MKGLKFVFYALVGVITIFPILTYAQNITNINGIVISEEEYNNFLKVRPHESIMMMDEEDYNKLKSLDYTNVVTETKYIETTYNPSLNLTTERELTKAEYDLTGQTNDNARLPDGGVTYETTAKKLMMSVVGGSTYNYVTLTAGWKVIPNVRSFDVIGFLGDGFEFRNGSQNGEQIYLLNDNYTVIDYAWNGTNIKKFDNGFGISMNIVNSDIEALALFIECDVKQTSQYGSILGSYQHATSSVSLANSQNYTLGSTGLGSVFSFPYNIRQKYDGMSGVRIDY